MLDVSREGDVAGLLQRLDAALAAEDVEAATALFCEDGYWRDLVSFTWNLATLEGRGAIGAMLRQQLPQIRPTGWRLDPGEAVTKEGGITLAWIHFETVVARGYGVIRLKGGKIWTLLTTMAELKGHEEPVGFNRPLGTLHGNARNRTTWAEDRAAEERDLGYARQPYVVILGGGQGGIALGARLRQLGVPAIIVEKNDRAGDSWRKRYKSLCLHDVVWYDHLPYLPFPPNWPVFSPKDKMGDWLEMYTRVMELTYWTRSTCTRATFDEATREWSVVVDRDGVEVVLRPRHLVLATGMAGRPNLPDIKGMARFKGAQHHSAHHPGPDGYKGKRAVVIGSNNSAHDIAAALWESDCAVTMVQRSSNMVVKSDTLMAVTTYPLYSEQAVRNGITVDKADLIGASLPYAVLPDLQRPLYEQIRELDADFYADLAKAGFRVDWGDDGSGLFLKYVRRGSGYYIDVGASQLIIDGKISLAHGAVAEITEDAVVLADGTTLACDLIVHATGYGSMNGWAADLIGQQVADKVGICWGLGSGTTKDPGPWVGELRNMWKPTQQEALWFHGGNLHQSRHFSQFLALQLKARLEGIATPVYGIPPTHVTR